MIKKSNFADTIVKWAQMGNLRDFPWRREHRAWAIALAEILLARTPANRVLPVYEEILLKFRNPSQLANASIGELTRILRPLGLQAKKAVQLKTMATLFAQPLPKEVLVEELKTIPGMGPYSYHATLLFALGIVRPMVDINIKRVLIRYFGTSGNENFSLFVEGLMPKDPQAARLFFYGMLDLAALFCKKKPRCKNCPLSEGCSFVIKSSSTKLKRNWAT
ncbi:MAG: hypothetical protein QW356_07785 [Candidatus Hadarchaeales archaeon]